MGVFDRLVEELLTKLAAQSQVTQAISNPSTPVVQTTLQGTPTIYDAPMLQPQGLYDIPLRPINTNTNPLPLADLAAIGRLLSTGGVDPMTYPSRPIVRTDPENPNNTVGVAPTRNTPVVNTALPTRDTVGTVPTRTPSVPTSTYPSRPAPGSIEDLIQRMTKPHPAGGIFPLMGF